MTTTDRAFNPAPDEAQAIRAAIEAGPDARLQYLPREGLPPDLRTRLVGGGYLHGGYFTDQALVAVDRTDLLLARAKRIGNRNREIVAALRRAQHAGTTIAYLPVPFPVAGCTRGADCQVHPGEGAHNYDPTDPWGCVIIAAPHDLIAVIDVPEQVDTPTVRGSEYGPDRFHHTLHRYGWTLAGNQFVILAGSHSEGHEVRRIDPVVDDPDVGRQAERTLVAAMSLLDLVHDYADAVRHSGTLKTENFRNQASRRAQRTLAEIERRVAGIDRGVVDYGLAQAAATDALHTERDEFDKRSDAAARTRDRVRALLHGAGKLG